MTVESSTARGWHVGFGTASLRSQFAHGGDSPILCDRVLEHGALSACRFVDLVEVPVGAEIGLHTHEDEAEELYVIICGAGSMQLDGNDLVVAGGDVVVNRPGGTHGLRNTGTEPLKLVVIEVPVYACSEG